MVVSQYFLTTVFFSHVNRLRNSPERRTPTSDHLCIYLKWKKNLPFSLFTFCFVFVRNLRLNMKILKLFIHSTEIRPHLMEPTANGNDSIFRRFPPPHINNPFRFLIISLYDDAAICQHDHYCLLQIHDTTTWPE